MTLDQAAIDVHVNALLAWLAQESSTTGEVMATLARALLLVLDRVPLEDRNQRIVLLVETLNDILDDIEDVLI